MQLLAAVLGFLLRKAGLLLVAVISLFLVYLLVQSAVPAIKEAVTDRERLQRATAEQAALQEELELLREELGEARLEEISSLEDGFAAEIDDLSEQVSAQRDDLEEKLAESEECGRLRELFEDLPGVPNTCDAKERVAETAQETLDALESSLAQAEAGAALLRDPTLTPKEKLERLGENGGQAATEREIATTELQLDDKQEEVRSLEKAQGSGVGWVVDQWARSWKWLVGIALLALLMPLVLRVLGYFVLMPLVARIHRPIHLAAGSEQERAHLRATDAQRTLVVDLTDGEMLSARSQHVRPVEGSVRGRLLYDWSAPFISFAAGLYGLSRVTGDGHGASATLATPDDPDSYLVRIDFADHPGVVMRPRHVVGVIGAPGLETRWRWGLQSFATWQVRYIMFTGTGSLIVQGSGDVVATSPRGRSRMDQHLVMGFDSRLVVGVNRTEVFWPYLWGKTPLVADEFTGTHPLFWQKSSTDGPSNPIARAFDAVFSAIGKLLGF